MVKNMDFSNIVYLRQNIEGNFNPQIDDTNTFYKAVADSCGKMILTPEEADTAFRARQAAINSFQLKGATVCDSPNVVYAVAWYLTQSEFLKPEVREI